MKKIQLIFSVVFVGILASCSNQGAFSEDEKKKQDSADAASQEDKFKQMESEMGGDTANHPRAPKGMNGQNPVKPEELPGNTAPKYEAPKPPPPPANGQLPPEPVPQQEKR